MSVGLSLLRFTIMILTPSNTGSLNTAMPTETPTPWPTMVLTESPSAAAGPTSSAPSARPSMTPTDQPSASPSFQPSTAPTPSPSLKTTAPTTEKPYFEEEGEPGGSVCYVHIFLACTTSGCIGGVLVCGHVFFMLLRAMHLRRMRIYWFFSLKHVFSHLFTSHSDICC